MHLPSSRANAEHLQSLIDELNASTGVERYLIE